jgi:hypothetical protein
MSNKNIALWLSVGFTLFSTTACFADTQSTDKFRYPFYVGITGGYGATTWGYLVPQDPNAAMSLSTPISVSEGGAAWGAQAGYEFGPHFALEAAYMRFPTARLYFSPDSLFTFDYDGRTELSTRTETVSLMTKFMLFFPNSTIRAYSSVGIATVHRQDAVRNVWRIDPTFGAGFNYNLTAHWMTELGTTYTAGYGRSEVNPTKDFVPFAYAAFLRLAYRF